MQQKQVAGGGDTTSADVAMLECEAIEKAFGGVPVLKGVSLTLRQGSVTALAGENGAGKSTLMKIASGQYQPDAGVVRVRGEQLPSGNAQAAYELGIAIVPQELASVPEMTVWENLFLGRALTTLPGVMKRGSMIAASKDLLAAFGLSLDPRTRMGALPVGIRQIIEIIKATSRGAKVLLLDEPSSAIAEAEVERLIDVVRTLRNQGVAVLFTTHKMKEIRAMADRVLVLRDGRLVSDTALVDISDDQIVEAMIGRELEQLFPTLEPAGKESSLRVAELVLEPGREPISLELRRGEIVGLAGLVGAGRTELLETVFGMRRAVHGTVYLDTQKIKGLDPAAAIKAGLAMVPEDRKGAGAVLSMSILENATLPRIQAFSTAGILRGRTRTQAIGEVMKSMNLKSRGLNQSLETLSGGNQQKVVLGRWLTGPVQVLLLDEPTRGVDIGARSEIYRIIANLAAQGMTVLMASSDLPEILSLTHRTLVMRDRTVVGEFSQSELADPQAQDRIFRLASAQLSSMEKEQSHHV